MGARGEQSPGPGTPPPSPNRVFGANPSDPIPQGRGRVAAPERRRLRENEKETKKDDKMKAKVYAIMVAALIAVAGVIVYTSQSDADGLNDPVTNGKMTVNISYGSSWELPRNVDAYNGAIALDSATTSNDIDMDLYTTSGGYVSINYQYGAFTTINGTGPSNGSVWNVYVLNTNNTWVRATDTLGWYKPFADYDASHRTANIAVVYADPDDADDLVDAFNPTVVSTVVPVSDIVGNEYFKATFYIKVSQDTDVQAALVDKGMSVAGYGNITPALLNRGVYVTGYGSDLYLALKNAFPNLVVGQEVVPCYDNGTYSTVYSWITSFLTLYTIQVTGEGTPSYDDDSWAWWQEYAMFSVDSSGDVIGNTSDFALGLYSTIDDAPLTTYSYAMYFAIGGM